MPLMISWKVADGLESLTRQRSAHLAKLTASFQEVMLKEADMPISSVYLPFTR